MKHQVKHWVIKYAVINPAQYGNWFVSIQINAVWYNVLCDQVHRGYELLTNYILQSDYLTELFLSEYFLTEVTA